jgi:hypothetical protein
MKVIVEQVAWIKVERHLTHTLEISAEEYALIQEGESEYEDIESWAADQELSNEHTTHYDYDEEWEQDEIESVEVVTDEEAA